MGARCFDVWYGQQTLWCDRVPLPSVPTHVNNIYYIWVYTIKLCIRKYCQPCQENLCLIRLTFCMRNIHFCHLTEVAYARLNWLCYANLLWVLSYSQNCGFKSGKYKRLTIPMHCSRVFMHVLLFFVLRHVFSYCLFSNYWCETYAVRSKTNVGKNSNNKVLLDLIIELKK